MCSKFCAVEFLTLTRSISILSLAYILT